MSTNDALTIYTDGSCLGNPGPGGWGVIVFYGTGDPQQLSGHEAHTTNNRMELMAAIQGLEALTRGRSAAVYTDSTYVQKGITVWITKWKRNGWRTAARKPVKNKDLWRRLEAAMESHDVDWHWVKGHAGHPENERADALARQGAEQAAEGAG